MNLRERGITWVTVSWITMGALQIIVGWGDDADMNQGLIFIVMAVAFAGDARLQYQIQELPYRLGELEYQIEQTGGSRGLP